MVCTDRQAVAAREPLIPHRQLYSLCDCSQQQQMLPLPGKKNNSARVDIYQNFYIIDNLVYALCATEASIGTVPSGGVPARQNDFAKKRAAYATWN